MARGPRGEKRPDDPAAAVVRAVRIALGEVHEQFDESKQMCEPMPPSQKTRPLSSLAGSADNEEERLARRS